MFLVEERKVELSRFGPDRRDRVSWYVCRDEAEVEELIRYADRPGFGSDYERVALTVHEARLTKLRSHEPPPITMLEAALETEPYQYTGCTRLGSGVKVKVGLRGEGWDGPAVFWDGRGNSFAIVKPPPDCPAALVTDQGVLLCSINGIGEIRWDVYGSSAKSPENAEAVAHFQVSWPKP